MSTKELKTQLQEIIDQIEDEELLEAVYKILSHQKIAGYEADGTPITREHLKERVQAASKRVKSGDYISHEEVKKEIE